ncbi:MAG: hypothetical protein CMF49_02125 [Legionellales bacterium]|nr:hypothetical protein [Legionellales bacterium]
MAGRFQNLSNLLSNMRTRTILFATGGILILVIIVGFIGFSSNEQTEGQSATVRTTRNIQSVPGLTAATPEYASVQQNLNEQNYNSAVKKQGSAIPTVIGQDKNGAQNNGLGFPGTQNKNNASSAKNANKNGKTKANAANPNDPMAKLSRSDLERLAEQQKKQLDALNSQDSKQDTQAEQQQLQQAQSAMQRQAQQLMASWSGGSAAPTQQYVAGKTEIATLPGASGSGQAGTNTSSNSTSSTSAGSASGSPIIKTGDILFAVLNTEVNSDEPGPIMATVVQGPLKGAKLVGTIQQTRDIPGSNGPTRVVLNFTTMSVPNEQNSLGVSAVAIDPDTARTALASEVDHHYLERYGSLFASAFLEGYGSAVQQSGSTVTNSIFGGSSTAYGSLSGIEEVAAGLGQVGQEWGSQLGDVLDRPNTIVVHSGVGLGILFLSDVTLDQQGTSPNIAQQPNTQSIRTMNTQPNIASLPAAR